MLLYLKYLVLFLLAAVILLNVAAFILFRATAYLSRPEDTFQAKETGDKLLQLKNSDIVVVVAHPDDADWYAGGVLAILAKTNKVTVVVGTSGELGGKADGLGQVREQEQSAAGRLLGFDKIVFLRHPDRHLSETVEFERELTEIITAEKPEVVMTFDIEKEGYIYRHSDHRAAGLAARNAVQKLNKHSDKSMRSKIDTYYFHTSAPNVIADVSDVVPLKQLALSEHRSQRNGRATAIFRYMPFLFKVRMSAGSAQPYASVGVSAGEPFRYEAAK